MSFLEAIILGIIQGLTEFLPVSSSGHLELAKVLLSEGKVPEQGLLFTIVVHAATALSTIVVFRKDIVKIFNDLSKVKQNEGSKYSLFIIISMIPAALVGFFLEDRIEELFNGNLILVGSMLVLTALLLYLTTRTKEGDQGPSAGKSLTIGIAQAIAILPGVSRSGATISVALFLGLSREEAARFSFLMVLPLILGAMALKCLQLMQAEEALNLNIGPMAVGFVAAFAAGVLACRWMVAIVKRSKLVWFAVYCLVVGLISIIAGV